MSTIEAYRELESALIGKVREQVVLWAGPHAAPLIRVTGSSIAPDFFCEESGQMRRSLSPSITILVQPHADSYQTGLAVDARKKLLNKCCRQKDLGLKQEDGRRLLFDDPVEVALGINRVLSKSLKPIEIPESLKPKEARGLA